MDNKMRKRIFNSLISSVAVASVAFPAAAVAAPSTSVAPESTANKTEEDDRGYEGFSRHEGGRGAAERDRTNIKKTKISDSDELKKTAELNERPALPSDDVLRSAAALSLTMQQKIFPDDSDKNLNPDNATNKILNSEEFDSLRGSMAKFSDPIWLEDNLSDSEMNQVDAAVAEMKADEEKYRTSSKSLTTTLYLLNGDSANALKSAEGLPKGVVNDIKGISEALPPKDAVELASDMASLGVSTAELSASLAAASSGAADPRTIEKLHDTTVKTLKTGANVMQKTNVVFKAWDESESLVKPSDLANALDFRTKEGALTWLTMPKDLRESQTAVKSALGWSMAVRELTSTDTTYLSGAMSDLAGSLENMQSARKDNQLKERAGELVGKEARDSISSASKDTDSSGTSTSGASTDADATADELSAAELDKLGLDKGDLSTLRDGKISDGMGLSQFDNIEGASSDEIDTMKNAWQTLNALKVTVNPIADAIVNAAINSIILVAPGNNDLPIVGKAVNDLSPMVDQALKPFTDTLTPRSESSKGGKGDSDTQNGEIVPADVLFVDIAERNGEAALDEGKKSGNDELTEAGLDMLDMADSMRSQRGVDNSDAPGIGQDSLSGSAMAGQSNSSDEPAPATTDSSKDEEGNDDDISYIRHIGSYSTNALKDHRMAGDGYESEYKGFTDDVEVNGLSSKSPGGEEPFSDTKLETAVKAAAEDVDGGNGVWVFDPSIFGVTNKGTDRSVEDISENIDKIVEAVPEDDVIVWVTPSPAGENASKASAQRIVDLNSALRDASKRHDSKIYLANWNKEARDGDVKASGRLTEAGKRHKVSFVSRAIINVQENGLESAGDSQKSGATSSSAKPTSSSSEKAPSKSNSDSSKKASTNKSGTTSPNKSAKPTSSSKSQKAKPTASTTKAKPTASTAKAKPAASTTKAKPAASTTKAKPKPKEYNNTNGKGVEKNSDDIAGVGIVKR